MVVALEYYGKITLRPAVQIINSCICRKFFHLCVYNDLQTRVYWFPTESWDDASVVVNMCAYVNRTQALRHLLLSPLCLLLYA